jgi:hypothetical protein
MFYISVTFNNIHFDELKALKGPSFFPLNAIVDRNDFVLK